MDILHAARRRARHYARAWPLASSEARGRINTAQEAVCFYEHVRRAGWTRTPDPRDSPGEASLRFRKRNSDCLFNVYESALLMTEAERNVTIATQPSANKSRYYVFAFCMSAQPTAPRG